MSPRGILWALLLSVPLWWALWWQVHRIVDAVVRWLSAVRPPFV